MQRRRTSRALIAGIAFAGMSFFGTMIAAATPAAPDLAVAASAPSVDDETIGTRTNGSNQVPNNPRTAVKPSGSVYGPYVSMDQMRLVAD
jgi:hypothetical protein